MTWRIAKLPVEALAEATELLRRACAFDDAATVAAEKLFGDGGPPPVATGDADSATGAELGISAEPLGAFVEDRLVGVACTSGPWLRILAVDIDVRERGIGSALLAACEAQVAQNSPQVRLMAQPGNYLSPGIDVRNQTTITWLARRGYIQAAKRNTNLLIHLVHNPAIDADSAELPGGYRIERLAPADVDAACTAIAREFTPGWAFEVRRAAACSHVHVARNPDGALSGFAAHDGNNRGLGWFGPTGVWPQDRKHGLGAALLIACLRDVKNAGHPNCQIAWIGPRNFYAKLVGIDSERSFATMTKKLGKTS